MEGVGRRLREAQRIAMGWEMERDRMVEITGKTPTDHSDAGPGLLYQGVFILCRECHQWRSQPYTQCVSLAGPD